jgi:hypothetical protein
LLGEENVMGLIDVPKSKEEIQAYLGDGNVRPAPFVANADINDGDILAQTTTIDLGGGSYKFSITLPSGRNLESAPVGSDYPKRDATFQWLDAVRSTIVGDANEAAETAYSLARQREPLDIPAGEPVAGNPLVRQLAREQPERSSQPGDADPVQYAREQLSAALQRLAAVADAERDVERWRKVVAAFTGEAPAPKKRKKRKAIKKAPLGGL